MGPTHGVKNNMDAIKTCQYENAYEARGGLMKMRLCGKPAGSNGWCKEHGYVQDLLDLAAKLDYPAFVVAYARNRDGQLEPCYTVGAGGGWKAYAARHTLRHHKDLMTRLTSALRSQRLAETAEAA